MNRYASCMLDNKYEEISSKFSDEEKFTLYLETLSDDELKKYEDMLEKITPCDYPTTLYEGYAIELNPDVEETEILERAKYAINSIDQIFEYDYAYG